MAGSVPDPAPVGDAASWAVLLGEARDLALTGRSDDALALADELLRHLDSSSDAALVDAARLARAAVASSARDQSERDAARVDLEDVARGSGAAASSAQRHLARLLHAEGRTAEAAVLLKQVMEALRRAPGSPGALAEAHALALSMDVSTLRDGHDEQHPAAAVDADAALLLRLVEFGKGLAGQGDPDLVLQRVLDEAVSLFGAERGFVVRVEGEDVSTPITVNMDAAGEPGLGCEVSRSLVRQVARTRVPAFVSAAQLSAGDPAGRSLDDLGVKAVACVPIVSDDEVLGVLYLDRRSSDEPFGRRHGTLLELFAGLSAAALENAESHRAAGRALEAAEEAIRRHRSEADRAERYEELLGSSQAMREVRERLDLVVPTEMPVLVLGETGTGKDVVARLIHSRGPRRDREFVAVNCAGLPATLIESELFGHERGAFTGADRARPGLFEVADGGTLFLDEIGDMSAHVQADLLRVLQSGEVRRVGGRRAVHVDVRVIAATHRDLVDQVRRAEFRQDLYYRLNVLTVELPALRERPDDVPLLCAEMLRRFAAPAAPCAISDAAMRRLCAHSWPGNVRELENVVRRLLVMGVPVIEEKHLPREVLAQAGAAPRPGTLRDAEDDAVRRALEAASGNKAEAARILGVDRKTLYAKLRRLSFE